MLSTQEVQDAELAVPFRRQWNDDRGAATLEQLGVVVVAALLVVAGTLGVANYGPHLSSRLCELANSMGLSAGACEQPVDGAGEEPLAQDDGPNHEAFQPPVCTLQTNTVQSGGAVKLVFFTAGSDSGFVVSEQSDGTVLATATDGGSVGLEGGVGAKVGGKNAEGVTLGANVTFGADLTLSVGDTWKFDSMEDWNAMETQLREYLSHKQAMRGGGIIGPVGPSLRNPPKPGDPTITTNTIGISASVSGQAGLRVQGGSDSDGKPKWFNPNLGVYGSGTLSDAVTFTTNHETGETSETFTFTASGEIGANVGAANAGPSGEFKDAYKVTRNAEGEITGIEFMRETSGGTGAELALDSSTMSAAGTSGSVKVGGGEKQRTVTTTQLPVTDENRAIVDEWVQSNSTAAANGEAAYFPGNAYAPTQPIEGDPLATMLYEEGLSSVRVYDNVEDGWSFGAEFALGAKVGGSISSSESESTVSDAMFLGAPNSDGERGYLPDEVCVR